MRPRSDFEFSDPLLTVHRMAFKGAYHATFAGRPQRAPQRKYQSHVQRPDSALRYGSRRGPLRSPDLSRSQEQYLSKLYQDHKRCRRVNSASLSQRKYLRQYLTTARGDGEWTHTHATLSLCPTFLKFPPSVPTVTRSHHRVYLRPTSPT